MARHLEDLLTVFTEKYRKNKVLTSCLAEATGTFLLVFFGLGFTANAILVNSPVSLFAGAFLWGLALTLGIYVTASISTGTCVDRGGRVGGWVVGGVRSCSPRGLRHASGSQPLHAPS